MQSVLPGPSAEKRLQELASSQARDASYSLNTMRTSLTGEASASCGVSCGHAEIRISLRVCLTEIAARGRPTERTGRLL